MTGIISCGIFAVLLIALAIYMMTGRGWFLLANYNMMSKGEKEKYDQKALCRFVGKILLVVGILTFPLGIAEIIGWYFWLYITLTIGLGIFSCFYVSIKNRFKN
ncbi:MAG: DUF3784 domain-containing protein [Oscillospiraceae bacterium]|nr:DUF3784 domain-containing protein [Oscillospiraceae bacterium]